MKMNYAEAVELRTTSDGSHTLFNALANETYHSSDGAVEEAMHVYVSHACEMPVNPGSGRLNILEVGFGAGLNAVITLIESHRRHIPVYYEAIEPFPLPPDVYRKLNYCNILACDRKIFESLHESPFDMRQEYYGCFTFVKRQAGIENFTAGDRLFDVIYFDAFSPDSQPEMWTEDVFCKLYAMMPDNGIILTYSSKGSVKRALRAAGFKILRLPGAGNKRHMLKGIKMSFPFANP